LRPVPVTPLPGRGLNRHRTAEAFSRSWLRAERIDLPITDIVPVSTAEDAKKVLRVMDALEEHDDVDSVHANFDVPEEVLEKAAAAS